MQHRHRHRLQWWRLMLPAVRKCIFCTFLHAIYWTLSNFIIHSFFLMIYSRKVVLNQKTDISDGIGKYSHQLEMDLVFCFVDLEIKTFWIFLKGVPSLRLALCLLGAWICVFLIISRGVKSSGKCSYFLALFPYVIMIALLFRAVTLEGATKGIIFFLTPQWHELINPKVISNRIQGLFTQFIEHQFVVDQICERRWADFICTFWLRINE